MDLSKEMWKFKDDMSMFDMLSEYFKNPTFYGKYKLNSLTNIYVILKLIP